MTTDVHITTVTSYRAHRHHAQAVAVAKLFSRVKESASGSCGTLSVLVTDQTTNAPLDIRAGLANPETLNCSLRRESDKHMPKSPVSLNDPNLDAEWTITIDGYQFLSHDSVVASDNSMLVFGTERGLQHLAEADSCHMVETFDVASLLFTQLYVICVLLGDFL